MLSASSTCLPRMVSATKRAFCADKLAPRNTAATSDIFHPLLTFGFLVRNVTFERSGRCEFAEFMTNHVFSYENRDRKSTRLNSSHVRISYAVFCLKKKNR